MTTQYESSAADLECNARFVLRLGLGTRGHHTPEHHTTEHHTLNNMMTIFSGLQHEFFDGKRNKKEAFERPGRYYFEHPGFFESFVAHHESKGEWSVRVGKLRPQPSRANNRGWSLGRVCWNQYLHTKTSARIGTNG